MKRQQNFTRLSLAVALLSLAAVHSASAIAPRPGSISSGFAHSCGIQPDGTVACWGFNDFGQSTPPGGEFTQVSAGGRHTCGVESDGTVACWGNNALGQATPPAGTFTQVSAGGDSVECSPSNASSAKSRGSRSSFIVGPFPEAAPARIAASRSRSEAGS